MTMKFVVAVVALVACGGGKPTTTQTPVAPVPAQPQLTAAEVAGYWTGDWGQLVLQQHGDKMVGAYSHDEGMLVGTLQNGLLVGWWCEVPSRKPPGDAGDVEMKFVTVDGKRSIDGRWRYGTEGEWREDWDISWDQGAPAEELTKRLASVATECTK
jgi:hypothetical protein